MSMIGIDLPFVHGLYSVVGGSTLSQPDLQALLHKSSAVLFFSAVTAVALTTKFYTSATNKSQWAKTRRSTGFPNDGVS